MPLRSGCQSVEEADCWWRAASTAEGANWRWTAPPGRRSQGKIVGKKVGEMKDHMEDVVALVHQYVPPDPAKLQAVVKAGKAASERSPEGGPTALSFSDYVKRGDKLSLGFDPAAKKIRNYNVASYLDKPEDAVTVAISFDSLQDGTNYPKETLLNAKSKQIQVKITNSGHKKAGP